MLAKAALAACQNNPDLAQYWIMTHGSSPARGGAGGGRGPSHGGGGAAARAPPRGHAVSPGGSSGSEDDDDEEAAEAAFQRDLEKAQLASEALSRDEEKARELAFKASARAEPIETFEETSRFLVRLFERLFVNGKNDSRPLPHPQAAIRGKGGPAGARSAPGAATLTDDELRALLEPLAELLLFERQALHSYKQAVVPYFRRIAAQLAATPAAARAAQLRERVREVGDPTCTGSLNALPAPGRAGGSLPAVFDGDEDGALVLSDGDDVVVLD